MIDRHIVARLELQAIELPGHPEGSRLDVGQLQIRVDLCFVDVEACLARLLGVVAPVPGLQAEAAAGCIDEGLEGVTIRFGGLEGRGPHLAQQVQAGLGGLGHAVGELVVRVRGVAQQLRPFRAQGQDLGDAALVVLRVAVVPAAGPHAPGSLAQCAPVCVGEEGLHGRARVGNDPVAGVSARAGLGGGGVDQGLRQAGEVCGLLQQQAGLFFGQQVLGEGGVERGQALVDLRQAGLGGGIELRAATDELDVVALGHALLFG